MELEKTLNTRYGKFLLRPFRDEDEDAVIHLWEKVFRQKMLPEIWKWKFTDNPFGMQIMLCLNSMGNPVAMYAGIPFHASWQGQHVRFTHPVDVLSHPDYRAAVSGRKGLFVQTADHFFDVYAGPHSSVFLYGFPGSKSYRIGQIFLDYRLINKGSSYHLADLKKFGKEKCITTGFIDKISHDNMVFDQLWKSARKYYPFAVIRDNMFMKWRFFDHPKNKYNIYVYKNWLGKVISYGVILTRNNCASIIDIFSLPDKKALSCLITRIAKDLVSDEIKNFEVWIPINHFISKFLMEFGFREANEPLGIFPVGRSFYEKLDFDFAAKHFFFTMADGDLF